LLPLSESVVCDWFEEYRPLEPAGPNELLFCDEPTYVTVFELCEELLPPPTMAVPFGAKPRFQLEVLVLAVCTPLVFWVELEEPVVPVSE
jgi:hypothetical protein